MDFAVGHEAFSTSGATELAGDCEAGLSALDDEFAFHFGEAGHDVEEEAAGGGGGVDGVGEAFELDALLVELIDQVDELFDAAA